jgi:hypothetical protein
LDQVTLVGPNDFESMKLHIMATYLHAVFIKRTFYVYADIPTANDIILQLKHELPANALENVVFINENDVLSPHICSNKWIYQQLLKLSVDKLRKSHELSESFLFTDVDTLCLRETVLTDFQQDGKFIFFVASDNDQPILADNFSSLPNVHKTRSAEYNDWFWSMSWTTYQLLGITEAPHVCAIDACVIWSQRVMKKLKKHIEDRFSMPWYEAIVQQYCNFLLNFKNNFFYDNKGTRHISMSLQGKQNPLTSDVPGFNELYHQLRLGFSEWQLYTHYMTMLEKSAYKIGLLGSSRHPLVAEYNCQLTDWALLEEILESTKNKQAKFPNFIYFYPNINCQLISPIADVLNAML